MTTYDDLHRAHRGRVTRLCRVLLADEDEAADVAQEVFAKLHLAFTTDPRTIEWRGWLTRVTVNACRDRRRSGWWRWWRERGVDLDTAGLRSTVRTPEDEIIGREAQLLIWEAIRRLPLRQREVFALRQIEGFSTDEVAATLGIGAGSVKRHLFRAVAHLRGALGDDA
jgi:RNA polymerase sigma-70 factor (ECF subfamily)